MRNKNGVLTPELRKKIKNRKLVNVRVEDLKHNPMNPPERIETNAALMKLKHGVREYGVIVPIHFCWKTMTLCDGHRRLETARANGVEIIQGYRYDNLTIDERNLLFKHLNTTSVKYNGAQELFTYLEGGEVSVSTVKTCSIIQKAGDYEELGQGMKCLTTIRKRRKSPTSFAIGIKEYCRIMDDNSLKTQSRCLHWMMNVGSAHKLKSLIALKCPAHLLKTAIDKARPVNGTWEITA